jgi:cell division protein FtsW (lipid II flippase)
MTKLITKNQLNKTMNLQRGGVKNLHGGVTIDIPTTPLIKTVDSFGFIFALIGILVSFVFLYVASTTKCVNDFLDFNKSLNQQIGHALLLHVGALVLMFCSILKLNNAKLTRTKWFSSLQIIGGILLGIASVAAYFAYSITTQEWFDWKVIICLLLVVVMGAMHITSASAIIIWEKSEDQSKKEALAAKALLLQQEAAEAKRVAEVAEAAETANAANAATGFA